MNGDIAMYANYAERLDAERAFLDTEIRRLRSMNHIVAFAASCCQRMLPNIYSFDSYEGTGNGIIADRAVDLLWQSLGDGRWPSTTNLDELLETLQSCVFDEDSKSMFTAMAQEGTGAIEYAIRFARDPEKIDIVVQIAVWGQEAIIDWIENTMVYDFSEKNALVREYSEHCREPQYDEGIISPEHLNWLDQHPLLSAERQKQRFDLQMLQRPPALTTELIECLRQSSNCKGVQPFLRGIIKKEWIREPRTERG
jgi:hypothetical protein